MSQVPYTIQSGTANCGPVSSKIGIVARIVSGVPTQTPHGRCEPATTEAAGQNRSCTQPATWRFSLAAPTTRVARCVIVRRRYRAIASKQRTPVFAQANRGCHPAFGRSENQDGRRVRRTSTKDEYEKNPSSRAVRRGPDCETWRWPMGLRFTAECSEIRRRTAWPRCVRQLDPIPEPGGPRLPRPHPARDASIAGPGRY